jgi:acyl-CoA reductase-like NAD-dependent aldehyde dehydrogenase
MTQNEFDHRFLPALMAARSEAAEKLYTLPIPRRRALLRHWFETMADLTVSAANAAMRELSDAQAIDLQGLAGHVRELAQIEAERPRRKRGEPVEAVSR